MVSLWTDRISVLIKKRDMRVPSEFSLPLHPTFFSPPALLCKDIARRWLTTRQEEGTHQIPNLQTFWFWTSQAPEINEKTNFHFVSHSVYGILLWQPELTSANITVQQNHFYYHAEIFNITVNLRGNHIILVTLTHCYPDMEYVSVLSNTHKWIPNVSEPLLLLGLLCLMDSSCSWLGPWWFTHSQLGIQ